VKFPIEVLKMAYSPSGNWSAHAHSAAKSNKTNFLTAPF